MKCLYVFKNFPLASNFSGGASRHLADYLALNRLGLDIYVLRFLSKEFKEDVLQFESRNQKSTAEIRGIATWWQDIIFSPATHTIGWIDLLQRAIFAPINLSQPDLPKLTPYLRKAIESHNPDFIWAESTFGGAMISNAKANLPWVYSHHDFEFKIHGVRVKKSKRSIYLSGFIHNKRRKYAESKICSKATAILSGSQTEQDELAKMGGSNIYLAPTTYDRVDLSLSGTINRTPPQLFHLGSLKTTANYLGMMSYLEKVVPQLDLNLAESGNKFPTLQIIGETHGAKPLLLEKLKSHKAKMHGHVDDLGSLMKPFDIVIIPYEHDTGMRTKIPLLFNYAQVVVATEASVAGSPEIKPGENCIILPSLEMFPEALSNLFKNANLREKIGRNARNTFESEFMLETQLPIYKKIVAHMR